MLKKAGIAVTAVTAGLLAMSPLAFASGGNGGENTTQTGLVNLDDTTVQANVCDNNVNVLGIQVADLTGALGLASACATTATDNDTCKNEGDN